MINAVCREIKNHFAIDKATGKPYGVENGQFVIDDGNIAVAQSYLKGQYIAILGSILNDGVYLVDEYADGVISISDTKNETFTGEVYSLRIPRDFLQLVDKIKTFEEASAKQTGNITEAKFGIQSLSFATDGTGAKMGWQSTYARELNKYRRMFADIEV